MIKLYTGDCLDIMPQLDADSIDTIITDPPYGLSFMGKDWDHGVPGVPFWQVALRVAKPGAIMLAFGGTRTFHRLTCAIEDAGWIIRDCISWLYGSGFPKSHDISKAIDRHGGKPIGWFGPWLKQWRQKNGIKQKTIAKLFPSKTGGLTGCVANWELGLNMPTPEQYNVMRVELGLPFETIEEAQREILSHHHDPGRRNVAILSDDGPREYTKTAPATPEAQTWHGYGTALKPAWEPIIVAMKPLDGSFANNALTHGVAGLWIEGGRIETTERLQKLHGSFSFSGSGGANEKGKKIEFTDSGLGRFPANLIHDGSDEVLRGFPETASGYQSRDNDERYKKEIYGDLESGYWGNHGPENSYADSGSAARFFYTAKADRAEREAGLEGMAYGFTDDGRITPNDTAYQRGKTKRQNTHATVKPISLMRYLCRITKTPTGGVVLDPFMGSGSTGCAAVIEERDFIGIEMRPEFVDISARRIKHWGGPLITNVEVMP